MKTRTFLVPLALALAGLSSGQNCANTSVGFTPLNDLGSGQYQGFEGGLYPGGGNTRPDAHGVAGLIEAGSVVPRDAAGIPDPVNGKIGFISIGMSNTRAHFNQFVPKTQQDAAKDPRVVVVNTAQGGQSAQAIDEPNAPYWGFVDQRIAQAGLTREQVQVLWFLEANPGPNTPFPQHALVLESQFKTIMGILRDRFPNARICYLASRIYAGYATTSLNPEPYAYEQGFANKWVIEDQMAGDAELNFDPNLGPVEAPWIAWGPYMWADGLVPRSDGLIWECPDDFQADGTHPSSVGANKVATALLEFVHTDATAKCWYLAEPEPASYGAPKITSIGSSPTIGSVGPPSLAAGSFELTLTGGVPTNFALAFYSPQPDATPFYAGTLYVGQPLVRLPVQALDGQGATSYFIPVTAPLVGSSRYYQFFLRDPLHPDGSGAAHSDGLRVCFFN